MKTRGIVAVLAILTIVLVAPALLFTGEPTYGMEFFDFLEWFAPYCIALFGVPQAALVLLGRDWFETRHRWGVAVLATPILALVQLAVAFVGTFVLAELAGFTESEFRGVRFVWVLLPLLGQLGLLALFRSSRGSFARLLRWIDSLDGRPVEEDVEPAQRETSGAETPRLKTAEGFLIGVNVLTHVPAVLAGVLFVVFGKSLTALTLIAPAVLQLVVLVAIFFRGVRWLYYVSGAGLTLLNVAFLLSLPAVYAVLYGLAVHAA